MVLLALYFKYIFKIKELPFKTKSNYTDYIEFKFFFFPLELKSPIPHLPTLSNKTIDITKTSWRRELLEISI